MKKWIIPLFLILLFFTIIPLTDVFGCEVSIIPSKTEVSVGEVITVDILRTKTHKVCVLPIEETKIEIIGGEIVNESPWITGDPDKKTIEVKFTQPGDGIIKITRDCPKGGLMEWTQTIKVVANETSTTTTTNDTSTTVGTQNTTPQQDSTTNTTQPSSSSATQKGNKYGETNQNQANNTESQTTDTTTTPSNPNTTPQESNTTTTETQNSESNTNAQDTPSQANQNTVDQILHTLTTPQNILYIALIVLGLVFFIKKWFKLRYLLLLISLAILGFYFGGCPCPVSFVERIFLVPFGSVASISILILLGIITIITLFKGRIFCGWVCPHGALQEFLFQKKVEFKIPSRLDNILKYLKYIVLITVVAVAILTSTGLICKFDPFKSIYNLNATSYVLIVVAIVLISSIFIYRPWCRYICPFGAYLGIVSLIGEKLHLNKANITKDCVGCATCLRVCPANAIESKENKYKMNVRECFTCADCCSSCSKNKKI